MLLLLSSNTPCSLFFLFSLLHTRLLTLSPPPLIRPLPPPSFSTPTVTFASDAEVEKGLAAYASTTDFKVEKPAEKQRRNRGRRSPRS